MATSVVFPRVQFFANSGRPLVGGRIHTYVAGSSTRARTYKDAAKAQPNANPIILDARGEASVYLAEGVEYKFVIEDSTGALIMTQEPVYGAIWPNAAEWPSDATLSYKYMTEAKAAAGAIGPIKFYDTYAQALGVIGTLANGDLIEVSADETRAGARTRYKVQAGALVFVVNLDQTKVDLDQTKVDLAAASGAGMVGFQQAGTGAVLTTVQSKLREVVSVKDFGAVGDGVTDDTAAIKAALIAIAVSGKGALFIPAGMYKITSNLTLASGQTLIGEGPDKSRLLVSGSGYDALTLSSDHSGVEKLGFLCTAPRASGSFIRMNSTTRGNFVKSFRMQNGSLGIHISAETVITNIEDGQILDATPNTGGGILIDGGNDTFISKVVLDSSGPEPLYGVYIKHSQAVWMTDVDVIDFGVPLKIAPNGDDGDLVTWCFFSQVALDSSNGNGIEVLPVSGATVKGLFFDNCWSSTNYRGAYIGGTSGGIADTIHFTDCTFYNNAAQGVFVDNAGGVVRNIEFNNCRAAGNLSVGFLIGANVVGFAIRGCRSGAHAGFPASQPFGVWIGTGCDQYHLLDNNLVGNANGGAFDQSAGTSWTREVRGNLGYKTQAAGVAAMASGTSKISVNHGLAGVPVVVLANPTNTDLAGRSFWTGTFTATGFNIETSANVGANSLFAWSASLYA